MYVLHQVHVCELHTAFHYVFFRLPTSTLLGECHSWLLWALLQLHLLLPRELQPLPEVHPILLSGAHCVPSVSSQQLLQWVQCGVYHPQPDEVCELPVHCHHTSSQPKGNPCCRGRHSHAKWVTAADVMDLIRVLSWIVWLSLFIACHSFSPWLLFSGPGQFTIISVFIGVDRNLINVTYMEVSRVTIYSYWLCMTLWCEIRTRRRLL